MHDKLPSRRRRASVVIGRTVCGLSMKCLTTRVAACWRCSVGSAMFHRDEIRNSVQVLKGASRRCSEAWTQHRQASVLESLLPDRRIPLGGPCQCPAQPSPRRKVGYPSRFYNVMPGALTGALQLRECMHGHHSWSCCEEHSRAAASGAFNKCSQPKTAA